MGGWLKFRTNVCLIDKNELWRSIYFSTICNQINRAVCPFVFMPSTKERLLKRWADSPAFCWPRV